MTGYIKKIDEICYFSPKFKVITDIKQIIILELRESGYMNFTIFIWINTVIFIGN